MKIHYRVLPILADLIPAALSACDGILFDSRTRCPHCGGSLAGYDIRIKQFAVLINGGGTKTVSVRIKRFLCSGCRAVVYAHQPFYPNTRVGSPVVDLCVALTETMPYSRASTYIQQIGVIVDRWSVRNYARKGYPVPPTIDMSGIRIPLSFLSLSTLVTQVPEGGSLDSTDILEACRFPSAVMSAQSPQAKTSGIFSQDCGKDQDNKGFIHGLPGRKPNGPRQDTGS
jgi:hypothetical protein